MALNDCCKVALGVGQQSANCDIQQLAGARYLKIALLCYILSVSETVAPDQEIDDIVMRTLANDPVDGDDDYLFYNVGTKDKTLSHTFKWTCADETDRKTFEETITGQIQIRTARVFNVLQQWMCKDVVAIAKEAGDDGKWFLTGLGGGLKLREVSGGTGEGTRDNNNTTITISGDELIRSFIYINAGSTVLTETLIDSITSPTI